MVKMNRKWTIGKYLDRTNSDHPLLGTANKPYIVVSSEFQSLLVNYIKTYYYDYALRKRFARSEYEEDNNIDVITQRIQNACDDLYLSHEYTYTRLFDTTQLEYNPIENYRMKEHEDTENAGTDTTTHNLGSHTDSTSYGSTTINDVYGNSTTTNNIGARSVTVDATKDVAPFESQNYQHVDKTHDSTQQASAIDTHEQSSRTDRHTQDSHSDSTTYGGRVDKDSLEHGHSVKRELTRSGNIGVTTSQQMLESEREVTRFNFVRVVANDLIQTLCVCCLGVRL